MSLRGWAQAATLFILIGAGASQAFTLCVGDESILFNCTVKKSGKIVSICLKGKDGLSYRFGKLGKVELEFPGTAGADASGFFFHSESLADSTNSTLAFSKGDTRYTLVDQASKNAAPSKAWLSVDQGAKNLAKLECGPNMEENLDNLTSMAPQGMTIGALPSGAAPSTAASPAASASAASPSAASSAAAPSAGGLVCDEGKSKLVGYRQQVADIFRSYSEKKHEFYAFAVKQFGPPASCAIAIDDSVPAVAPANSNPDEDSYSGTITWQFKNATLVMTSRGGINAHLTAPNGFPDEAAAKKTLAKATEVNFKRDGPPEKFDDASAGTHTERYTSGGEESEQGSLVTKNGKLIAIDSQY